jgi:uncharacterized protein
MDPQKQREIASKGGKAAHQKGTAHEFTTEEARIAGRKGGAASRARRTATQGEGGQDQSQPDEGAEMAQAESSAESNGESTNGEQ